jgi:hypothetical protein
VCVCDVLGIFVIHYDDFNNRTLLNPNSNPNVAVVLNRTTKGHIALG